MGGLRSKRRGFSKARFFLLILLSLALAFPLAAQIAPEAAANAAPAGEPAVDAPPAREPAANAAPAVEPAAAVDAVPEAQADTAPADNLPPIPAPAEEPAELTPFPETPPMPPHLEQSGELMNLSLGDSSVSLNIRGRWKGTLNASLGMAFTPFGVKALLGEEPFFAQEGDLTLSLWLRDRWFLEASFMDESALNTYRLGYRGLDGEVLRYLGIGNTGLDFPVFPYLDLGGDTPSSFGIYGHAAVGRLSLHSLVRYDAAAREERIFVGDRERSYSFTDLSRPQRGISFILPDRDLSAAPVVFIEDSSGDLTGSDLRRWRRALSGEYAADTSGRLILTLGTYTGGVTEPESRIAVAYSRGSDPSPWTSSMGRYNDVSDPLNPDVFFLAAVQDHFDAMRSEIRLWDYPQPGRTAPLAGILRQITPRI